MTSVKKVLILVAAVLLTAATPSSAVVFHLIHDEIWGEQTGHCQATFTGEVILTIDNIEIWYNGAQFRLDARVERCIGGYLGAPCSESTTIHGFEETLLCVESLGNAAKGTSKCGPFNSPTARIEIAAIVDNPGGDDLYFLDHSDCAIADCVELPY